MVSHHFCIRAFLSRVQTNEGTLNASADKSEPESCTTGPQKRLKISRQVGTPTGFHTGLRLFRILVDCFVEFVHPPGKTVLPDPLAKIASLVQQHCIAPFHQNPLFPLWIDPRGVRGVNPLGFRMLMPDPNPSVVERRMTPIWEVGRGIETPHEHKERPNKDFTPKKNRRRWKKGSGPPPTRTEGGPGVPVQPNCAGPSQWWWPGGFLCQSASSSTHACTQTHKRTRRCTSQSKTIIPNQCLRWRMMHEGHGCYGLKAKVRLHNQVVLCAMKKKNEG